MYNGQHVSLETILWKVTNGGLYDQLNPEDAYMYAKEAIRLLKAPLIYKNKVTNPPLTIVDHKAKLPSDLITIRGVRLITNEDMYEDNPVALRYATDIYHESRDCEVEEIEYPVRHPREYTYEVNGGIITTSVSKGKIQIAYKTLNTCENGYPLIPDDEHILYAVEYHIRWRYLEHLWEMGKVPDKVFNHVSQQRDWYMGSAQAKTQLAGMDHLESTMNAINRLIIPDFAQFHGFKRLGKKEEIKRFY